MKAAVYYRTGPPSVFQYEEVPDPVVRPKGIVFKVEAVSIEGGDVLHRAGGELVGTPHIVGYQAAGEIVAVGEAVTDRFVGQKVVATMPFGSHAELASVPSMASYVVPDGADLAAVACVPVAFGTADDCLFEFGHLQRGETVLVQGAAGGVGLAAVQLAKRAGATVLATASTGERLQRLREYGVDHGINYVEKNLAAEALRITGGQGVDLVVDPVGGGVLQGSIDALRYRGRIAWVGNAGREEAPADVRGIMQKNATITGVYLGAEFAQNPARTRPMIEGLIADVARGDLKVAIERTFPLSEAAAAHELIESRKAFGRVVLVP